MRTFLPTISVLKQNITINDVLNIGNRLDIEPTTLYVVLM